MTDRTEIFGAREAEGIVRCDACPVLCRIRPGRSGACDRYANIDGNLVRTDPVVVLQRTDRAVPFLNAEWSGNPLQPAEVFVSDVATGLPPAARAWATYRRIPQHLGDSTSVLIKTSL